ESKRKTKGTGEYFSSQITFFTRNQENKMEYKIKLFRNGIFQVPGIKSQTMFDLIQPIKDLRDYLQQVFKDPIEIVDFHAVMRNYKTRLINSYYMVDLKALSVVLNVEKKEPYYLYV